MFLHVDRGEIKRMLVEVRIDQTSKKQMINVKQSFDELCVNEKLGHKLDNGRAIGPWYSRSKNPQDSNICGDIKEDSFMITNLELKEKEGEGWMIELSRYRYC